ncbi:uncharacterized protein LOC115147586 [Salmo trutta]|uniref:uncharacterized protein LOC115147586 n=1 Tax=Salmo trutta TaxID=8032 RepID=UPI001130CE07|nr:uncharacterized protein LOC115147586 [Salmo trutta]
MVLASHQQEREMGDTDMSPEMANKDQFDWYTNLFPEVQKAVEERRVRDGTLPPRPDQEDSCLVGFGNHKSLTYKDLYEAKDKERKSYMACFRKYQVKPGTSMGHFKVYVQRRDTATAVEPPNPSAEPSDQELLSICVGFDQAVPTAPTATAPPAVLAPTAPPQLRSTSQATAGPVQPAADAQVLLPEGWEQTLPKEQQEAGVAPPKLLYVNRDCCALMGKGKTAAMFSQWDELIVRLDVWHFIRRFARGVTTESHPLYALFMQRLSSCMLVWCADDVERLREAKRGELKESHITGLSDTQLMKRISLKEMARHCRRRTRGAEETERLIGELLDTFMDATDTMGIRLLDRDRMQAIWQTQRHHLVCIQDPPDVSIYTNKGKDVTEGGVILPVLRCSRGSTSLESFHLHRFIPGTSACAEHFQAYLFEGLVWWNEDRAEAGGGGQKQTLHCYDGVAQYAINELSQKLLGCSLVKDHTRPAKYTGELIGVEYLFSQTHGDQRLESNLGKDPDVPDGTPDVFEGGEGEEEDLGELEEEDDPTMSLPALDDSLPPVPPLRKATPPPTQPNPSQVPVVTPPDDTMEVDTTLAASQDLDDDEYIGPDGVSGYQHVVLLAKSLVRLLEGPWISNRQIEEIMALWGNLPERDKAAVSYPERFRDRVLQGHFKNSKTSTVKGEESMKRSLLGQGSGPAQWPNTSRTVEAIFVELCHKHPAGKTVLGNRVNRWGAILGDYRRIRTMVLGSPNLKTHTRLQL